MFFYSIILIMLGKRRDHGLRNIFSVGFLDNGSKHETCFLSLVTLRGTSARLILYLLVPQMKYVKERWSNATILQFPHVRSQRLSEKRKPSLCLPRLTLYNLALIVTEWAVIANAANLIKLSFPKYVSLIYSNTFP